MALTAMGDNLSDVAIHTDISLRGMQDAGTQETAGRKSVREDLYPGDTKGFMEQEKLRWPKGDTVVLYTNPDTIIIISEFLEADGGSEIIVSVHLMAKELFPFFPAGNRVSYPTYHRPDDGRGYEEGKKNFHVNMRKNRDVPQLFPI